MPRVKGDRYELIFDPPAHPGTPGSVSAATNPPTCEERGHGRELGAGMKVAALEPQAAAVRSRRPWSSTNPER